jgi:CheY-like chemotaxis protein
MEARIRQEKTIHINHKLLDRVSDMDIENIKILVVEDDALNQTVARLFLEGFGYKVDLAANGEAAIRLFQQNQYALVLMDVGLPGMNGTDVTRRIRALEEGRDKRTPVIAATAHGNSYRQQCLDAGMDDVLSKPLMMDILKATLDQYAPLKPDNKTSHQ